MAKKNRNDSRAERAERAAEALRAQQRREQQRRAFIIGGVALVVLAIIVGVLYGVNSQRDTSGETAQAVPPHLTDGYGVMVGSASAPHTLTLYEDFQCPICDEFEKVTYDRLSKAVAEGKVRIDYRMVAFLDRSSSTNYSTRALNAAAAVLAAAGPETFVKFHHLLYEHQPAEGSAGLTDAQLIDYAVQAGASRSAVTKPIVDETYKQWTVNATDQMSKNGVNGTPTVFVDGKQQGDTLQAAIEAALGAIS